MHLLSKIAKIKHIKLIDQVHVYMCLHIATFQTTAGNKARPFPSPFLISTSLFLILTELFRNDHVDACSTALRSATEKVEMGGYVTVPCSSKKAQRISMTDWPKF